jgi:hypothetical protein
MKGEIVMKKLKRVVIKEEFVCLTGDTTEAVILNQFIYWSERVNDFDRFITEEKERAKSNGIDVDFPLTNGWIYKKISELKEEIMSTDSEKTIRRRVQSLVEKGFLHERKNPQYKWDNTRQYRVNLIYIAKKLHEIGYRLEGYKYDMSELTENDKYDIPEPAQNDNAKYSRSECPFEGQNDVVKKRNDVVKERNDDAIPEITTEITTKKNPPHPPFAEQVRQIFDYYVKTFDGFFKVYSLTKDRRTKIEARLREGYTPEQIKTAIANIRRSPFHCGKNDKHKFYADITFICRSGSKIEEWINYQPPIQETPVRKRIPESVWEKIRQRNEEARRMRENITEEDRKYLEEVKRIVLQS